jgi:hypothetical protein
LRPRLLLRQLWCLLLWLLRSRRLLWRHLLHCRRLRGLLLFLWLLPLLTCCFGCRRHLLWWLQRLLNRCLSCRRPLCSG